MEIISVESGKFLLVLYCYGVSTQKALNFLNFVGPNNNENFLEL